MGDQLISGLGQAWAAVATFVPKLLLFLVILLIGWLIAKGVSKAVGFLLDKIGFSRLLSRAGLDRLLANSPIDAGGLLVKLVYYFILLIALNYAFGVFGPSNPISQLLNDIVAFLPRVLVAVILVVIAAAIANVVRDLVSSALGRRPYTKVIGTVVYVFLLALGIIAALNQLGIATTVTLPVLVTVLATIGGILVVGVGGGLIGPMRGRWENWLAKMDAESAEVRRAAEERRQAQPAGAPAQQQLSQQQQQQQPVQYGQVPPNPQGDYPHAANPVAPPSGHQADPFASEPTRRLDQPGGQHQAPPTGRHEPPTPPAGQPPA